MIKYVIVGLLAVFFIGCSGKNEVTISNIAEGNILVNFRAETHLINPGNSITIDDIPNGTYDYSTTYAIPSKYTAGDVDGDAASGVLIFEDKNTQINFVYSSSSDEDTYVLGCTISSTRNQTAATTTSP